jgi:hypothetical protein
VARYGPDGRGIESPWGRDFPHPSRPALVSIQPSVPWLTGLCPGSKVAGACRWPPTPTSTKVKEKVELYPYSPSGPSRPVSRVNYTFTFWLPDMSHSYHYLIWATPIITWYEPLPSLPDISHSHHYLIWATPIITWYEPLPSLPYTSHSHHYLIRATPIITWYEPLPSLPDTSHSHHYLIWATPIITWYEPLPSLPDMSHSHHYLIWATPIITLRDFKYTNKYLYFPPNIPACSVLQHPHQHQQIVLFHILIPFSSSFLYQHFSSLS